MRLVLLVFLLTAATTLYAQDEFDKPPIEYSRSSPDNAISQLQAKLDAISKDVQAQWAEMRRHSRSLGGNHEGNSGGH